MSTIDFFISYSQTDKASAEWIAWQLENASYSTVLQAWDFRAGSNFALEMHSAVQAARRIIIVLSPDYLTSQYAASEWAAAFASDPTSRSGNLIPVRVRPCEPTGLLKQIVYIDLVGLSEESAKAALLNGLIGERSKPRSKPVFEVLAVAEKPKAPTLPNIITLPKSVMPERGPHEERTENGIVYVRIYTGTFTMGSVENYPWAMDDEKPAHPVTLSEFWISKTAITNEQYRRFRRLHRGKANLPATLVSWEQAKAACEYFGGRLPTEAEWEYAARAGSQTAWSFGDDEKMLESYAWYDKNSNNTPHMVGTKRPNAWGLYDMHGNVWEWVQDWYGPYPYPSTAQTDPAGPERGECRVLRGGSYFFPSPSTLRSAARSKGLPTEQMRDQGFRCVLGSRHTPHSPALGGATFRPRSKS